MEKWHPLSVAAFYGDWKFLKKAYEDNKEDLSYFSRRDEASTYKYFILTAVSQNHHTFLSEALTILPREKVLELVCLQDSSGNNPLHYAAMEGNIFTTKLLVNAYDKAVTDFGQQRPPWLVKNENQSTPIHCCFILDKGSGEAVAKYLASRDHSLLAKPSQSSLMILNKDGDSPVFCGMRKGYSQFVELVLNAGYPYSVAGGSQHKNPLHYASKCNEEVALLLLEKHPKLISQISDENGDTVLHRAVRDNATWLVELMLKGYPLGGRGPWNKACRRLIWQKNTAGDSPLHLAASKGNVEIAELLIQGYNCALQDESTENSVAIANPDNDCLGQVLWKMCNSNEEIPLHVALKNKHDDSGVFLSSLLTGSEFTYHTDKDRKTALYIAVENGCERSTKTIMERSNRGRRHAWLDLGQNFGKLNSSVMNIVGYISSKEPEEAAKLLEKALPIFIKHPDKDARKHLEEAAESQTDWFIELLMESDKSLQDSIEAWKVACENGSLPTLFAFLKHCDGKKFIEHCQTKKETPLHHMKALQYEHYKELVKNPIMICLANQADRDGATPMHRAIERKDLELVKALLECKSIQLEVKDKNRKTAIDLILENVMLETERTKLNKKEKNQSDSSWYELYKEVLVDLKLLNKLNNHKGDNGLTPLHLAIQLDDLNLVKALLETKDINLSNEDKGGRTPLNLLEKRCKSSKKWGKMCREIEEDSTIKQLKQVLRRVSLEGMQNSLSVVAALLATITFAAGFTIPGGVDIKDGTAVLATKAAFLVFFFSNSLAMCGSIVVLFMLLGPMMWDTRPALSYVDFSLSLLQLSLFCTIVAFLTGVYAIIAPKVMWAAVVVIVVCSVASAVAACIIFSTYCRSFDKFIKQAKSGMSAHYHSEHDQSLERNRDESGDNNIV